MTGDAALMPEVLPVMVDQLRTGLPTLTESEQMDLVRDQAHGCVSDYRLLGEPLTPPDSGQGAEHVSYEYEYACRQDGAWIHGWSWVGFSPDGRRHTLFLTAPDGVWQRDHAEFASIAESLAVAGG